MKKIVTLAVLSSAVFSQFAQAIVIYGDDGRKEVHEASELHQKLARSTPVMVHVNDIGAVNAEGLVELKQMSFNAWLESQSEEETPADKFSLFLQSVKNGKKVSELDAKISFCAGERFVDEPNPGQCSGFLIAPDLVATAGHCAEVEGACEGHKWIFDFKVDAETGTAGRTVNPKDIYSCKRIITSSLNMDLGTDFAIIQLDRKVEGREPLEIRYDGAVADGQRITVIGNPSGLPLKVTEGGQVRANVENGFFTANLDTYAGNSGSAVFNVDTNVVEGILVRGENDFILDEEKLCMKSNLCAEGECRGEDVSRMTSIPEVALKEMLNTAAEHDDVITLETILAFNIWVDFYGKDGVTSLMKAAARGKTNAMVTLLARGAEANITDTNGNTALHYLAGVLAPENTQAIEALKTAGIDMELKNAQGKTALEVAFDTKNIEGYKLLLQAGAKNTVIIEELK